MGHWRCMAAAVWLCPLCGCFPHETRRIGAVDPQASIPAIQNAAHQKDYKAVPELVAQLESDDAAVRFYAIEALQRITGQTLGYHYYDDLDRRKRSILRWRHWEIEHRWARTR